jgi:tetratricopeptide (TPR) repeat protein
MWPRLADYYTSWFRVDDVEKILRDSIVSQPESVALKLHLIRLLRVDRWDEAAIVELGGMVTTEPNKAITVAKRALEQNGELFTAATLVMRAYSVKNDADKAIEFGEGYRSEHGANASVDTVLAQLYLHKKQPNKAVAVIEEALKHAPESIQSYLLLSRIHTLMGNPELKEATYQQGVAANPANVLLKTELAVRYQTTGRVEEALQQLEEAYALEENSVVVINNLSALLIDHYPTEENLRRVQVMTREFKDSNQAGLLDTLGWLQYKLGNVPQAINLLRAAQERGGKGPDYWYHLGMASHQNGDLELAKELRGKALEVEGANFNVEMRRRKSTHVCDA